VKIVIAVLNLALLFSLSWWIWKHETASIRKFYWTGLLLKLASGMFLGIVYSTYYTDSDTFFFFTEAVDWSNIAQADVGRYLNFLLSDHEGYFPGEDRMYFMIKVTSIFSILAGNNYWIVSCYFSLISFLSAWYLTKVVARYFPDYAIPAIVAFLFFPSCVFWSSGIIKESLAMTALFYLSAEFLQIWFTKKISVIGVLFAILSVWVGWNLKYYYFGLFIPVIFSVWLVTYLKPFLKITNWQEVTLLFLILTVGLIGGSFLHPNFSLHRILEVMVSNNQAFLQLSSPNDVIHFYNLEPTWLSLAINSPWAVFSGLFRPFIWEASNVMQVMASLENLLILVLVIFSVRYIPLAIRSEYRLLILGILIYCVVLCAFLSISAPNFGTLARYRVGFLPFFILLIANHPFISRQLTKLMKL